MSGARRQPEDALLDDVAMESDIRAAVAAEFGFTPELSGVADVDASFWQGRERQGDLGPAPFAPEWAWRGRSQLLLEFGGFKFRIVSRRIDASGRTSRSAHHNVEFWLPRDHHDGDLLLAGRKGKTFLQAWHAAVRLLRRPRRRLCPKIQTTLANELLRRGPPA